MVSRRHLLALFALPIACVHGRARDEEYPGLGSGYIDEALAAEMRRVPITMYMTDWCPHCLRAREWLDRGGYTYRMLNVDYDGDAAETLGQLNPRGAVPTFDVDGLVVQGFRPPELEAAIRRVAEQRM